MKMKWKSAGIINLKKTTTLFFTLHPPSPQEGPRLCNTLYLDYRRLLWDELYFYIGHTLFSGMGSWANEQQSVEESSDLGNAVVPTGMRAAMADISPVWLSAVIPGRSEVWFMLLSGMVPMPVKCWIRHFRNWTVNNNIICHDGGLETIFSLRDVTSRKGNS